MFAPWNVPPQCSKSKAQHLKILVEELHSRWVAEGEQQRYTFESVVGAVRKRGWGSGSLEATARIGQSIGVIETFTTGGMYWVQLRRI
jgi:hypothetical protein